MNVQPFETAAVPLSILSPGDVDVFDTPRSALKTTVSQPSCRNFFGKAASKAKISNTIDSTARTGENVSRRRFQRGSVFQNKTKTMWLGLYPEYSLDSHGVEKRLRKQITLCPVRPEERVIGKRLKAAFGKTEMRKIGAGDIQRLIAASVAEGLEPKTVRNLWGKVSLIWNAALAQKYVDVMILKPKLPRRSKKKARFFALSDVPAVIAASLGETRVFPGLRLKPDYERANLPGRD